MAQYRRNKETGVVEQLFKNQESGEEKWFPTKLQTLPGVEAPPTGRGSATKRQQQATRERYRENLEAINDAAMFERDKAAQEMGTLEKGMILAGKEVDKLGAGLANMGDFLGDVVGMDTTESFLARGREQKEKDVLSAELEQQAGAANLFKALPYLATGYGAGPGMQKLAQGAINRAGQAATATGQAGKGLLTQGVNRLAQTRGPTGQMGRRMQREWTEPLAQRAAVKQKQIGYTNPYREGFGARITGDTALGATESGIHYDQSPVEGALASSLGRLGGEVFGPAMRRSPDFYNPAEREVVDWAESEGMRLLPGQRTGNRAQQMHEAGFRSDDAWSDTIKGYDRANETIMNRITFRSMGIPEGQVDAMTPSALREHMGNLKQQYQALEAGTVGRLDAPVMRELDAHVNALGEMKGAANVKNARAAKDALEELQRLSTREKRKDARGRYVTRTFSGKEYQSLRRNLKQQIDKAYANSDNGRAEALKPMLQQLDAGMEKGIANFGGEASAAQWKDLNEKYAMSKLFMKHGSTPTGELDAGRLRGHFQTSDPERLLMETGGRVTDLHKLAKLDYVLKNHAGSALSGTGMGDYKMNPGQLSMKQRLLATPAAGFVPVIPDLMMRGYARGYPSVTGLANMGAGKDALLGGNLGKFWEHPGLYTRALAQGTQIHPKVVGGGINSLNWLIGKGEEGVDTINNLFSMQGDQ